MATDIQKVIANLSAFYDLTDRIIISVGAGGGQLVEYGRPARRVFAVDHDRAALEKLRERLAAAGLEEKYTLVHSDFLSADLRADVVLFEFCLHEMPDPAAAIQHAGTMAPNILIMDHGPGSEWSFIAAEEDKVARLWSLLSLSHLRKVQTYETVQRFGDYEELRQKVMGQGEVALARIVPYQSRLNFTIPMTYRFALI